VCLIDVRDGVLVRASSFVVERALMMSGDELSASEVLQRVLVGAFSAENLPPGRVVASHAVSNETIDLLCSIRQAKVDVKVPQRGALVELLKVAEKNASTTLRRDRQRRAQDATARRAELEELRVVLGLMAAPLRIECLDVSHTMGQNTTAAFGVIEEGQPRRSKARTFNLDTGNNDVLSIATALQKRVEAARAQAAKPASERDVVLANLPQLFLIDGGLAQLQSAQAALAAAQCLVPVASIAKRLEEVYLPGRAAPLRLDLGSNALYVLQRARDEAHNVSIKAQRKRRQKAVPLSVLDTVKGLGAKRIERLRTEVGGIEVLRQLSREKYPSFLPALVADELHKSLHPELHQR
jgi:excinuclease ABC subunit C